MERLRRLNERMPSWPVWIYGILTIPVDIVVFCILQWSVYTVDPAGNIWKAFGKMFDHHHNLTPIINVFIIFIVHLLLVFLFNRYWGPTLALLTSAVTITVFERFKIIVRGETIQPSDITLAKNDVGSMLNFIPEGSSGTPIKAAIVVTLSFAVFSIIRTLDGRRRLMKMDEQHRKRTLIIRVVATIALAVSLFGLAVGLGNTSSPFSKLAETMGDSPKMWDSVYDAQSNGLALSFTRVAKPKIMDQPKGYSKQKMEEIAKKYSEKADSINVTRGNDLTNETMVMILSESFSDPSRAPGITLNKDVMPNLREVKKTTPSGFMFSSGYGGGTANLEYMAGTGLSMANFNPSLTSPYQQLVPKEQWTPAWNQLWEKSIALHPYKPSMYSRAIDYDKLGYERFYNLVGPDVIQPQNHIDNSPYVSDESAYTALLNQIKSTKSPQYLSLATMQNHMGYDDWYKNNEIQVSGDSISADENGKIKTYAKGFEYTDAATKKLLDELDAIDRPINLVFYGDHLPGIYSSATDDPNNSLALHETDWFVWSNKSAKEKHEKSNTDMKTAFTEYQSKVKSLKTDVCETNQSIAGKSDGNAIFNGSTSDCADNGEGSKSDTASGKTGSNKTGGKNGTEAFTSADIAEIKSETMKNLSNGDMYASPNFFMEIMMEYSDSNVSPYITLLGTLRQSVSAMEPPVVSKVQSWSRIPEGQSIYLDHDGKRISIDETDKYTKETLEDYKLVQYDITAGKGYLKNLGFMDIKDTGKTMYDSVKDWSSRLDELKTRADNAGTSTPAKNEGKTQSGSTTEDKDPAVNSGR